MCSQGFIVEYTLFSYQLCTIRSGSFLHDIDSLESLRNNVREHKAQDKERRFLLMTSYKFFLSIFQSHYSNINLICSLFVILQTISVIV